MERLRKNASTLKLLHKAKPSLRKAILTKASPRDVAAAPQTPQLGGAQANFGGPS